MKRPWRRRASLPAGIAVSLCAAILCLFLPQSPLHSQQERSFDLLVQLRPIPADPRVLVVDIDRSSEGPEGEWTWSRTKTASLIDNLARAGATAIALDLIFSAQCEPDDESNLALASAIGSSPTILGFLLSDLASPAPSPRTAVAVRAPLELPDLWLANGVESSCAFLQDRARGTATVSLAGDADARLRVAPAMVALGEGLYPGLAVEAVRLGLGVSTPILSSAPPTLQIGPLRVPLDAGANARFVPSGPERWAERTISAEIVLAGAVSLERLQGAIVFVGSSLPRLGGLRATAASPLHPSVQIHADLANGILTGTLPVRSAFGPLIEAGIAFLGGVLATLGAAFLRPWRAAALAGALGLIWLSAALVVHLWSGQLLDPLFPTLGMLAAFMAASLVQFAATRRAEEALRRRFSQHLPQDIVARFVEEPHLLKLEGEERVVTALFTDIEGFSSTARLAGPRELIGLLDDYFDGMTRLVIEAGGMVDKIVGDAVHALFNAPIDLEDHTDRAIKCACEIAAFGDTFRQRPAVAKYGFGRTRVGVESGLVVLGDVGRKGRIDYTAHGEAVNLASRLEAANKQFGTAVLVGPGARALATLPLQPLGEHEIRGFGSIALYQPEAAGSPGLAQGDAETASPPSAAVSDLALR